ncbi:MAG: hypothetical protein F4118_07945, partial [Acidimicrobiaceae bacterium]|nr:hypothetical protein [Acidimicrobiaceae bacterium]
QPHRRTTPQYPAESLPSNLSPPSPAPPTPTPQAPRPHHDDPQHPQPQPQPPQPPPHLLSFQHHSRRKRRRRASHPPAQPTPRSKTPTYTVTATAFLSVRMRSSDPGGVVRYSNTRAVQTVERPRCSMAALQVQTCGDQTTPRTHADAPHPVNDPAATDTDTSIPARHWTKNRTPNNERSLSNPPAPLAEHMPAAPGDRGPGRASAAGYSTSVLVGRLGA